MKSDRCVQVNCDLSAIVTKALEITSCAKLYFKCIETKGGPLLTLLLPATTWEYEHAWTANTIAWNTPTSYACEITEKRKFYRNFIIHWALSPCTCLVSRTFWRRARSVFWRFSRQTIRFGFFFSYDLMVTPVGLNVSRNVLNFVFNHHYNNIRTKP